MPVKHSLVFTVVHVSRRACESLTVLGASVDCVAYVISTQEGFIVLLLSKMAFVAGGMAVYLYRQEQTLHRSLHHSRGV